MASIRDFVSWRAVIVGAVLAVPVFASGQSQTMPATIAPVGRSPFDDKPINRPDKADDIRKVADKFKGTHDLAGAAEALVAAAGSQFKYDYGAEKMDVWRNTFARIADMESLFGQRLMVCYEFVHYVAYLSGNHVTAVSGNPRVSSAASTAYRERKYDVWKGPVADIPRGKVVVFVARAFNNDAGYYHIGISLGGGKIAHNSSNGNVQISDITDVDSIGYKEVRVSDYDWRSAGEKNPDQIDDAADAATPSAPSNAAPSTSLGDSGLKRAIEAAPAGIRVADNSTCCGDPLGRTLAAPVATTTPRYQLFITGAPIDRALQGTSAGQHDAPAFGAASMLGLSSLLRGAVTMLALRQPVFEGPSVSLVATGASTGDAFVLRIDAGPGYSGRVLAPPALVLEPTTTTVPTTGGAPVRDASQLSGFCAEFQKDPPPPGTVYRVASAAHQERLKPMRRVLDAAEQLATAGRLHPDSSPASYLNSITQYAMWTRLEGWNADAFAKHFLDRTKKNLEASRQAWTREIEAEVKRRIPGRWADIESVLRTAAAR